MAQVKERWTPAKGFSLSLRAFVPFTVGWLKCFVISRTDHQVPELDQWQRGACGCATGRSATPAHPAAASDRVGETLRRGLGGGRGGIRTHGSLATTPDFESGAFNHSATLPTVDVEHRAFTATFPCPPSCPCFLARRTRYLQGEPDTRTESWKREEHLLKDKHRCSVTNAPRLL